MGLHIICVSGYILNNSTQNKKKHLNDEEKYSLNS